jgi:hypothetical protein
MRGAGAGRQDAPGKPDHASDCRNADDRTAIERSIERNAPSFADANQLKVVI